MFSQDQKKTASEAFFDHPFDISEVLIEYYTNQPTTGIDRHFILIEDFLSQKVENPEENHPLIIQCEEDFGVKTLLVKWLLYHNKNNVTNYPLQDIILPYFVTASEKQTNYFFAIFRFLIQLRERLNIKQKVELLEEKLRKFFGYWLDVCNRKIEKKIIKQKISPNAKIILIIHKIDNLIDPSLGKPTNIGFWLPKNIPPRVKIIATCHKDSEAMTYFLRTGCSVIRAQNDRAIAQFMIEVYSNRTSFTQPEHKQRIMECLKQIPEHNLINPKFLKTVVSCLIPYSDERVVRQGDIDEKQWVDFYRDFEYDRLEKLKNNEELIELLLDFYERKIMPVDKFRKLVLTLSICFKGLMFSEIIQLVKFSKEEWSLFLAIFKRFIIRFKGLFNCYDPSFKRVVIKKYSAEKDCNLLHEEIANVLERTPLSTRKLEEQTHHLFISKSYFKLKETISIIENFLLLFNPHNKFDLCHYWEKLLENGFDPAVEYNKAIEGFEMHYKPPPEDVFQIILQVSRFLKEFADFETENTPLFKHPPISGFSELNEIGLEKEIMNVAMYQKPDAKRNHQILSELEMKNMEKQKSHQEFRQHYIAKLGIAKSEESESKIANEELIVIENQEERQDEQLSQDSLKDVSANALNNMNSRNNLSELKLKLENNNLSSINNIQASYIQASNVINNSVMFKEDFSKLSLLVHENKPIESLGVYRSSNENQAPTYYYYKRWLWMIFPWACMSDNEKCNYSEKIMQCYSSPTEYISVIAERKFTERALKIALDAKLKKRMMYAKKEELEELLAFKSLKPLPSPTLKKKHASQQLNSMPGSIDHEKSLAEGNSINESESQNTNSKGLTAIKQKNRSLIGPKHVGNGSAFFITEQLAPGMENPLLSRSKIMELKFREYNAESLMYLSKSLEESSLVVLPKLKTSITKHSENEMQILERRVKKYKDQLDAVNHYNIKLAKELADLQGIFANRSQKGKETVLRELLEERILELEEKLKMVEESLDRANSQKVRILTVLNVCKKNKQQNEEYIRSLNFLLMNFKKCIKLEIESIAQSRSDIASLKKICQEMLRAVEEKLVNHSRLVGQIKNNITGKKNFNKEYEKTDVIIENSMIEALEEIKHSSSKDKKELKKQINMMERTTKSIGNKLDKYEENHDKLKELLEVQDNEFLEAPKYKLFLLKLERKSKLIRETMVIQDKVRMLRKTLESKKKTLDRLVKMAQKPEDNELMELSRKELHSKIAVKEKEHSDKCEVFIRMTQTRLSANLMLKAILEKCDIPLENKNKEILIPEDIDKFKTNLEEKLEMIKNKMSEEDFGKLMKGNYQIMEVYMKAIPKDSLLANITADLSEGGL